MVVRALVFDARPPWGSWRQVLEAKKEGAVLARLEAQALTHAGETPTGRMCRSSRLRALIQMATGGGKTFIAAIDAASRLIPHVGAGQSAGFGADRCRSGLDVVQTGFD